MKNSVQLIQRQNQKLTPQLQLTIKLLQYSSVELEREIDNALSINPVLERIEEAMEAAVDGSDPFANTEVTEFDTDKELPPESAFPSSQHDPSWDLLAEPISLQTHLNAQWQLSTVTARDMAIGITLIDALDADGYWTSAYGDIRDATRFAEPAADDEIDAVRHLIQRLDPVGTASRDLSECLIVQLTQLDADAEVLAAARAIAENHLNVLAHKGIESVAKAVGLPPKVVAQAAGLLKTLDPKPGAAFHAGRTDYIEADFAVEKIRTRWRARALTDRRQKLRISGFYKNLAREARGKDAAYLQQYVQEAQWLIHAIASRQDTLMKVVQAIAQKQQGFLEQGPLAMQAMTLREIADSIGIHESTVSRACAGKYLATPHGLFELGRLFRSGIGDDSGQVQAASAIQARIAALIKAESPQKPLSDARLESLLAAQGLPVARRTIAKYREALQIPASSERRKPA